MSNPAPKSEPAPAAASVPAAVAPRVPAWLVAVSLALLAVAIYWPAMRNDFVNYDDNVYVTSNDRVQLGLTWENVEWAFTNPVSANWHPVTMLSLMLDDQIFGLKPWGYHLTNVLLHAFNTVLVFLLLCALTPSLSHRMGESGRRPGEGMWRSAFVAALFAAHPLHVESVAWVAERKDVLSAFFGLLALIFYVRYARAKIGNRKSEIGNYLLALLAFALGLMSKPMLVTWPFVMLLLDFWPLERFSAFRLPLSAFKSLLVEKIPFFVLAAASSVVTFLMQKQGGAVITVEDFPLGDRAANTLISYCRYLDKTFWPADLAVFYPHATQWPMAQVLLAGVFLCGITALFVWVWKRFPFLLVGWLWFVGTLVPVIGLVQVGKQAIADRYTYLPSLGVFIIVIWGAAELARRPRFGMMGLSAAGLAAIVLCAALSRQQLEWWRDSEALFRHALEVTQDNYLAQNDLGITLMNQGRAGEAISHFEEAIRLKPNYTQEYGNLGLALLRTGQTNAALEQFSKAVLVKPDDADARYNLGMTLAIEGQTDEAINQYQEALRLKPDDAGTQIALGVVLLAKGRIDEAIGHYREALRLKPDDAAVHNKLGIAFAQKAQIDDAVGQFQEALRLQPDYTDAQSNLTRALELKKRLDSLASDPVALNNMAWTLATNPDAKIRNSGLAVQLAERACELTNYRVTVMVGTLAAAYAEAGRFDEAVATGQKACALATELGETNLLQRNQELVILYQRHQAYHEPAQ